MIEGFAGQTPLSANARLSASRGKTSMTRRQLTAAMPLQLQVTDLFY